MPRCLHEEIRYVEAFYHILNYLYMKGKINRHVNKCIHLLMNIAKDKAFERLIKLEKGKTSKRIGLIKSRHVHSTKLSIQAVTETHYNAWTELPLHQNLKTTTLSRNNKEFVKIAIYDARSATFVYMSKHVHVQTLFSM